MPENKLEPGRIAALADQCVQCGLCLPACPTYALDGNETESPRGRIALAAALAKGQAIATPELRAPLDHCLGCLNCERVCPAQVRFGELLVRTRALLGPSPRRPRRLLHVIKHPARLRAMRRLAGWIKLPRWKRALLRRLPQQSPWRVALATLAPLAPSPGRQVSDARPAASRLALFPGCVASVDDAQAQSAALHLLRAAGAEVSLLPAFCCGALDAHGGEAAAAAQAAHRVRAAWKESGADTLLTVTPGCLGTLRHAVAGVSVDDPYAWLLERAERLRFLPLARRVALHLPCTQLNVARSENAMLALLDRVPGLEVLPLRTPHCCGAAGSHMLEFPARAARLREPLLEQLAALAPDALLSSNIGCRLHLAAGLEERDLLLPTLHPLVLLAQQLEEEA